MDGFEDEDDYETELSVGQHQSRLEHLKVTHDRFIRSDRRFSESDRAKEEWEVQLQISARESIAEESSFEEDIKVLVPS